MTSVKVIVQGIPIRHEDCSYPTNCMNQDKIILEQLLATYGPAKCVFLLTDEIAHSLSSRQREVWDNFAHVIFENAEDSDKACHAAINHEIKFGNSILTLSPVSESLIPIENLNNECFVKLFSMLTLKDRMIIEQVCSDWKELVQNSWSNVKILQLIGLKNIGEHFEVQLKKFGKYVEQVGFSTNFPILYKLIPAYCSKVYAMKFKICIDSRVFSQSCVSQMFRELPTLRYLTLIQYYPAQPLDFLESLPETMKQIAVLSDAFSPYSCELSKFRHLYSLRLVGHGVINGIENLEMLNYVSLRPAYTYCFSPVTRTIVEKLSNLTRLKSLEIPGCNIDDDILIRIFMNNRDLEHVNVNGLTSLTDRSISVASTLPNLKILEISRLKVTLMFMDEMPLLEELACQQCGAKIIKGLKRLIPLVPNLQILFLRGTAITTDFLTFLNSCMQQRENDVILQVRTSASPDLWKNIQQSPLLEIIKV